MLKIHRSGGHTRWQWQVDHRPYALYTAHQLSTLPAVANQAQKHEMELTEAADECSKNLQGISSFNSAQSSIADAAVVGGLFLIKRFLLGHAFGYTLLPLLARSRTIIIIIILVP